MTNSTPPLVTLALGTGRHNYAIASEGAKKFELPPTLLNMLCQELFDHGFAVPTDRQPGDILELMFSTGRVEVVEATVH